MSAIGAQRQIPLEFAARQEPQFVLDGRCVEFPEGLRTAEFTHTLHRFPGKFVPQVARELLNLVDANERSAIADPFCGSGTSLVEASLLGIPCEGIDFDPLAVFISTAKTTALSSRQLKELKRCWTVAIGEDDTDELTDAIPNFHHWFKPHIARQLAFIKRRALQIDDDAVRHFSLVLFSSIIRRVSNADDQTQKTYVSGTLKKKPPTPSELFPVFLDRAVSGMEDYAICAKGMVAATQGDARAWRSRHKLDGIVTSPPYIDSIDYVYNQMLEYFWLYEVLGFTSAREVQQLRKKPVGFRAANVDQELKQLATHSPDTAAMIEPIVTTIRQVSVKEAQNVVGYFEDFAKHLRAARVNMKPGGIYALVIGESHIRGATVPTPQILASLFESHGFKSMGSCSYAIKRHYMKFPRRSNSGKINTDHVYCFKSP